MLGRKPDEFDLLLAASVGDSSAARALVERDQQQVYVVLFGLVLDRGVARDLTVAAFGAALCKVDARASFIVVVLRHAIALAREAPTHVGPAELASLARMAFDERCAFVLGEVGGFDDLTIAQIVSGAT